MEEGNTEPLTLPVTLVGLFLFNNSHAFERWSRNNGFSVWSYTQRQTLIWILRAFPQNVFSAAVEAGVTQVTGLEECCATLSKLLIIRRGRHLQESSIATKIWVNLRKNSRKTLNFHRNEVYGAHFNPESLDR
ncbi:hypothetical protein EGR_05489 [Echinococcus granulosus]|nr:hypothetical protein EGR_05489 [Echinococcus granulosus]EUB59590.1 hypothetical protein EGR_05489 [Echinococcus granulosus]